MCREDFSNQIVAEVTPDALRKIYDRLEDETTPHAGRVSTTGPGVKQLIIYCDTKDVEYFNMIITDGHKTKI